MSKSTYLAVALLLAACQVYAEREEKVLSFFNVVKFPNALCTGSGTRNGTCYTAEECEDREGTAAGSCADGFGVCCVITLGCGGSSAENNTYFVQASFTTGITSCQFTICPASTSICRIKMDFTTLKMADPNAGSSATTVGQAAGDCSSDSFSAPGAPVICGTNTGMHMFIDSDGVSCSTQTFTFDGDSTSREMDIMVKQYDCKSHVGGPAGCLQYFTGTTATITSFNYDSTNNARHLSNQNYDMCIRRESGYCYICYLATQSGLSISDSGTIAQAVFGSNCIEDYLIIPAGSTEANAKLTALAASVADRFCGRFLTSDTTALGANADVCTAQRPFKISFVSNGGETLTADSDDGQKNELAADFTPFGTAGFSLKFTQNKC